MSSWYQTVRKDRQKFVRDVQDYFAEAEQAIEICSRSTLSQIAPQFMQAVIDAAGFDDYTGVLANSYVMAMVVNGKVAPNMSINNNYKIVNKQDIWKYIYISNRKRSLNQWNSQSLHARGILHRMATIKAAKSFRSYHKIGRRYDKRYKHGMILPTGKIRLTNRFNRNGHRKNIYISKDMYESGFSPKGYGNTISKMRGINIGTGRGSGLVISNGAPYAAQVHNRGSVVIPMAVGSMIQGSMVTVMKNEFNKIKMIKR